MGRALQRVSPRFTVLRNAALGKSGDDSVAKGGAAGRDWFPVT